jgi:hypothetical protein
MLRSQIIVGLVALAVIGCGDGGDAPSVSAHDGATKKRAEAAVLSKSQANGLEDGTAKCVADTATHMVCVVEGEKDNYGVSESWDVTLDAVSGEFAARSTGTENVPTLTDPCAPLPGNPSFTISDDLDGDGTVSDDEANQRIGEPCDPSDPSRAPGDGT